MRVLCSSRMSIISPNLSGDVGLLKRRRRRQMAVGRRNLSKLTSSGDFSRISPDYAFFGRPRGEPSQLGLLVYGSPFSPEISRKDLIRYTTVFKGYFGTSLPLRNVLYSPECPEHVAVTYSPEIPPKFGRIRDSQIPHFEIGPPLPPRQAARCVK